MNSIVTLDLQMLQWTLDTRTRQSFVHRLFDRTSVALRERVTGVFDETPPMPHMNLRWDLEELLDASLPA